MGVGDLNPTTLLLIVGALFLLGRRKALPPTNGQYSISDDFSSGVATSRQARRLRVPTSPMVARGASAGAQAGGTAGGGTGGGGGGSSGGKGGIAP